MEFVETRTFPSVYFGKCYSASVMKRLESKANFWEIIFDVDVDIYLHQNRREVTELGIDYWREQPTIIQAEINENKGQVINVQLSQTVTKQNAKAVECFEREEEYRDCIYGPWDKALNESCWFPPLPFVPMTNELCPDYDAVRAATVWLRQALSRGVETCKTPCSATQFQVG